MLKAYKYRIYPTEKQETFLCKELGLKRLYWNLALAAKQENHKYQLKGYKQIFDEFRPEANEWCKEIDSTALASVWSELRQAYQNFFESCNGTRKGKFVNPPKFKSKKNMKDSITYTSAAVPKFVDGKLIVTKKLGPIEGTYHRFCEGKLKHVTFSRTKTGKWFVAICVDKKDEPKCENGKYIGIDWNCDDEVFLTFSDGTKVKCPRFLKRKEKRLTKLQKQISKKFVKGAAKQSNNYEKSKYQVAKLHEKVANQRLDWLHKLSRDLANKYENVVVENINLQNMSENLHHGKVVSDQGFGMLRTMISYKTNLIKVNPKNTSRRCHCCGEINEKVVLGVRKWECPTCGAKHDRDINAAINIMMLAVSRKGTIRKSNASGEPSSSTKEESPSTSLSGVRLGS